MVTAGKVKVTVDCLAVERGDRRNNVYHLDTTTGELLNLFELKPSGTHHRHIRGVVEMHYPGTTSIALGSGNGDAGFKLHIKIRSK